MKNPLPRCLLACVLLAALWLPLLAAPTVTSAAGTLQEGAIWYVDAAATEPGDGRTPETAVRTIPAGLALAASGDTVLVAAGVYTDTALPAGGYTPWLPLRVPPGVRLVGAGPGSSVIEAGDSQSVAVELQAGSRLEGFAVRGSGEEVLYRGVVAYGGGGAVLGNRIEDVYTGIEVACQSVDPLSGCTAPAGVAFNVVVAATYSGVRVAANAPAHVHHNTIYATEQDRATAVGIRVFDPAATVEANAVLGATWGIYCQDAAAAVAYNNVSASEFPYWMDCALGMANTEFEPLLRDLGAGDFHLTAGSPLRRRGPGGTDIGALPFVAGGAAPASVSVTPIGGRQARVEWAPTGAAAYDLFLGGPDGIYTQRWTVTTGTSTAITLSNPLANWVAVSGIGADGAANGAASELAAVQYLPAPLRDATVEQDNAVVWLNGDWQTIRDPNASGGSYVENTADEAQVQIAFSGDTLVLGRMVGAGGYAQVTVDGVKRGTLSFSFPQTRWRAPATLSGFGPGVHLLELAPHWYQPKTGRTLNLDFVTAPSSFAPSAAQMQAVERVNWHRLAAGLSPVAGVPALHQAAQAHSEYYAANRNDPRLAGLGFHSEQPDLPGFTGVTPGDRAMYFGYGAGAGEDGHFIGDPVASVDGWMATVYHRNLVLCYTCTDAGYGIVNSPKNKVDTLNMGGGKTRPAERMIYTYPAAGRTSVPRSWDGGEIPDPLPGWPKPVGYPLSLYIVQPATPGMVDMAVAEPGEEPGAAAGAVSETRSEPQPQPETETGAAAWTAVLGEPVRDASTVQESAPLWAVTAAELRTIDGVLIPTILLDQDTDIPKYLGPDVVFLIPEKPLAGDTTYFAHVAGTDSQGVPFDYRWAFSTGKSLAAPDFSAARAWVEPPLPAVGQPITVHVQLVNNGLPANAMKVRAVLPAGAAYLPGSARTTQGTVTGSGPLDFDLGEIAGGGGAELQFAFTAPAASIPPVLTSTIRVDWGLGWIERRPTVMVGGTPLYLPAARR